MLVQIKEVIASMMVLPNRQVFQLVENIQRGRLKWPNAQVTFLNGNSIFILKLLVFYPFIGSRSSICVESTKSH